MITKLNLEVYSKYYGAVDQNQDMVPKSVLMSIDWTVWSRIHNAIQNLYLIRTGIASKEFSSQIISELKANIEDESTFNELERMSIKFYGK